MVKVYKVYMYMAYKLIEDGLKFITIQLLGEIFFICTYTSGKLVSKQCSFPKTTEPQVTLIQSNAILLPNVQRNVIHNLSITPYIKPHSF